MDFRVYFEDTDAMGIVYHANYLKFCERARSEAFFLAGKFSELSGDKAFVLSELRAKYHASARLGDIISVKTSVLKVGKAACELEQTIYLKSSGAKLFSAWLKMVQINAEHKPCAMSEETRAFINSLGD